MDDRLERFADLAVRVGVNVQPDETSTSRPTSSGTGMTVTGSGPGGEVTIIRDDEWVLAV